MITDTSVSLKQQARYLPPMISQFVAYTKRVVKV